MSGWMKILRVPAHFTGKRVLEGEQVLFASGLPAVCVRFAGIYGPARTGLLERIRQGRFSASTQSNPYTNRIHSDDCVALLAFFIAQEEVAPCYVASDSEPVRISEVEAWLAARLGIQCGAADKSDSSSRVGTRHRRSKRCCNDRVLASGFQFQFPNYRDGYESILKSLQEHEA